MEQQEILRRRLRHQRITGRGFAKPAAVVRAFGAMQAQEFAMACWAVGLRGSGGDEAAVLRAFDAGEIVRTHVLRPTWHFVAAADLRWILALSAPRVRAVNAYQHRQLGLDAADLRRGVTAIDQALAGGEALTREELQAALGRAKLPLSGPALAYVVMAAELDAIACSGPLRGRKFTYMHTEKRVAPAPPLTREAALGALAQRFFETRGPATPQDFAAWSGLTVRDANDAVAGLGPDFHREACAGRPLIFPRQIPSARKDAPTAVLLPDYDEYGIGYRDRRAFLSPGFRPAFNRLILLDGRAVGSWRRTLTGKRLKLELQFSETAPARARQAIDDAAARYGRFIGRPASQGEE